MIRFLQSIVLIGSFCAQAQTYDASKIFAHNDYVRPKPFYTAYELGMGYIEVDVFLEKNDLMVAHHQNEISPGRTLLELYLNPLLAKLASNRGFAYPDPKDSLTIMIDLKTEGESTLKAVVDLLEEYQPLVSCPTLRFMISGSVPDPARWSDYPSYIYFDGRPGIRYNQDQLKRIAMISTSFGQHVRWDGQRPLTNQEREKMQGLMNDAHEKGKPFRFWGTPDFPAAWKVFMDLHMDVILTDRVTELSEFLKKEQ